MPSIRAGIVLWWQGGGTDQNSSLCGLLRGLTSKDEPEYSSLSNSLLFSNPLLWENVFGKVEEYLLEEVLQEERWHYQVEKNLLGFWWSDPKPLPQGNLIRLPPAAHGNEWNWFSGSSGRRAEGPSQPRGQGSPRKEQQIGEREETSRGPLRGSVGPEVSQIQSFVYHPPGFSVYLSSSIISLAIIIFLLEEDCNSVRLFLSSPRPHTRW